MKKRDFKHLLLHKKAISNLSIVGGVAEEDTSGGSEHALQTLNVEDCAPESMMPNTNCTCA